MMMMMKIKRTMLRRMKRIRLKRMMVTVLMRRINEFTSAMEQQPLSPLPI